MEEYLVVWQEDLGIGSLVTLHRTVHSTRADEAWNMLVRQGVIKTEDAPNGRVVRVADLWQPEIQMKPVMG